MKRVKVKARKLADARVQYISLVDRGANRIPFRIVKRQENDMIDIGSVFKSSNKAAPKAKTQLLAIAVEKREDMEPVRKAIKDAGFSIELELEREDGTVLFQQVEEIDEATAVVFKISDTAIALLSGDAVQKAEKTPFVQDLFKDAGYSPNMEEAAIAVCKSVIEEAANVTAENFEQYQTMMKQDFDALQEYIATTMTELPAELLALDIPEVPEAVTKSDDEADEGVTKSEGDNGQSSDGVAASEGEDDAVTKNEGDDEGEGEDLAAAAAKQLEPVIAQLNDMASVLKSVSDAVTAQGADLTALKESQEQLGEKVGEVEAVAKAANEALGGTIVGAEPESDDRPASRIPVAKADDGDPRTGIFDTAFLPGAKH